MADQGRSRRRARLNRSTGQDHGSGPSGSADAVIARLLGRCVFPEGVGSLDCAVSGGADSSALLVLARAAGYRVHAFHVDHGIRQDSHGEAERVAELAERFGAEFTALRCTVTDGPDLEARARRERHRLLPPGVMFGHTMEDQAETVLLRLMRGSGPDGLASMSTDQHPLLGLRRSETEELCEILGLDVFEDPTNIDPRFRRNRVRRELLPLMAAIAERDVVPLIARTAEIAGEQAELLDRLAADIDPGDAPAVAAAPRPLATRALRRWWLTETASGYPPDAAAIERMLSVARGDAIACDVSDGWTLRRSRQRLRLVGPDRPTDHVSGRDDDDPLRY